MPIDPTYIIGAPIPAQVPPPGLVVNHYGYDDYVFQHEWVVPPVPAAAPDVPVAAVPAPAVKEKPPVKAPKPKVPEHRKTDKALAHLPDVDTVSLGGSSDSYWETWKDDKEGTPLHAFINSACFYSTQTRMAKITSIQYLCPIKGDLTDAQLSFWIKTMRRIFTDLKWSFKRVKHRAKGTAKVYDCILWTLSMIGSTYGKNLIYLTAMRYPDEYPSLIKAMYKNRAKLKSAQDAFTHLQAAHWGKAPYPEGEQEAVGGHGLCPSAIGYYYGDDAEAKRAADLAALQLSTLAEFKARWADPTLKTLHDHFPATQVIVPVVPVPVAGAAGVAVPVAAAAVKVPAVAPF